MTPMKRLIVIWLAWTAAILVLLVLCATFVDAQTIAAARFRFTTGPCMIRSGAGSPEGAQVGNVCDQWHRTDTPFSIYTKTSGVGNTGWTLLPSEAGTLTGATLAANVLASSLTSVGTLANLTVTNPIAGSVTGSSGSTTGNAATATALQNPRTIAGVSFNGTANIAIPSTGLSDTANLARLNATNAFTGLQSVTVTSGTTPVVVSNAGSGAAVSATSSNYRGLTGEGLTASGVGVFGTSDSGYDFYGNGPKSLFTGLVNANGGIAVDTSNFTVSGTTGFVGIGTAPSATALLHAEKNQATGTPIKVINTNAAGLAGLYLNGDFGVATGGFVQYNNTTGNKNLFVGAAAADPLYLGTDSAIRMTVLPTSGNVGIGDTTPDALLDVAGTAQFDGVVTFLAPVRLMSYTVATLPAGVQGYIAYVTDALAPVYMATVVGGGAVVTGVFYNGAAWVVR